MFPISLHTYVIHSLILNRQFKHNQSLCFNCCRDVSNVGFILFNWNTIPYVNYIPVYCLYYDKSNYFVWLIIFLRISYLCPTKIFRHTILFNFSLRFSNPASHLSQIRRENNLFFTKFLHLS